ncbi:cupin domain-containing protein [Candidatus Woesearchaeota archaeon]|nr:cupin domain-containing protein [Candidatus Woesearchaeota archaeon]
MKKGLFKDLEDEMQFPEKGIFSKVLVKADNYDYTLMCLSAGTEIDEHTSSKDGVVVVLKGKGRFNLEGEKIEMKQGVFISMPANSLHSLKAKENTAILICLAESDKDV